MKIAASALILKKEKKYLIRKRPLGQIMGGLWEFPEWKLTKNRIGTPAESRKKTIRLAQNEFAIKPDYLQYLGSIKRNYTYFNETLDAFLLEIQSPLKNLDPKKIPCHRVIKSDGSLATGYAFGGMIKQREILKKEGIKFSANGTVALKKYLFKD